MPTTSSCGFIAAYCEHSECELFAGPDGNITAYIPTREASTATLELGTKSYATAEMVARQCGLEPQWN